MSDNHITFICGTCKREHPIELKSNEKTHNRCFICLAYKNHKAKQNTKTYEQIEKEYLARRSYRLSGDFVCSCCRKPVDKIHKRGICPDCWFSDGQRILRNAQKKIRGGIKNKALSPSFIKMFGFTIDQFLSHIESKLTTGMTMDDFISGKIHIDHIIPVSAFNHTDREQFKACWSLENMQPLTPRDNIAKHDSLPDGRSVSDIRLIGSNKAVAGAVTALIVRY